MAGACPTSSLWEVVTERYDCGCVGECAISSQWTGRTSLPFDSNSTRALFPLPQELLLDVKMDCQLCYGDPPPLSLPGQHEDSGCCRPALSHLRHGDSGYLCAQGSLCGFSPTARAGCPWLGSPKIPGVPGPEHSGSRGAWECVAVQICPWPATGQCRAEVL